MLLNLLGYLYCGLQFGNITYSSTKVLTEHLCEHLRTSRESVHSHIGALALTAANVP